MTTRSPRSADLKGKTTAQSITSNWAQVARDAGANGRRRSEGFAQAITLLNQGRIDATVNDSIAVLRLPRRDRRHVASRSPRETGETSEQGFAARKNSGLLPELNGALDELRADGTLTAISKKYLKADATGAAAGGRTAAAGIAAEPRQVRSAFAAGPRQPVAAGQGRTHR